MAMAAVFIVEALFELPMAAALIRVPTLSTAMLQTAFTLGLARGLVIALLLLMTAWPLAIFSEEPRLAGLLALLALGPAMRGLVSPGMVVYARAFNFRPDAAIELSGKVAAFAVSVGVAIATRSYWAIALASICAPLVAALLSYRAAPLRLRLTLVEWPRFSSLIGWNFVSQLCGALNWQIDRLLLPRLVPISAFGQYSMARQMAEIPFQALVAPLYRPAMAALASSGAAAKRYLQLSRSLTLLMAPVLALPVVWSEPLVRLALGPGWTPAAEWLRWICAVAFLGLPALLIGPLTMTLDRTRWMAVLTSIELLVRLPMVWIGGVHFGIAGAISGSAIATVASTAAALLIVRRLIGASMWVQLMTLWMPLMALVPAGAVLWLAKPGLSAAASVAELLLRAVALGALYLLVYGLSVLMAWRLAGRPAGLEQHLHDAIRNRFKQMVAASDHDALRRPVTSTDTMEAHVKQPH
jgi:O-antigen/teichoic acid export membrane protein